jgi:hypothetical protein
MPRRAPPTTCGVCHHPKRHLIEIGLCYGVPFKTLALRFNAPAWSVYRHGRNHMPPQMRAAIGSLRTVRPVLCRKSRSAYRGPRLAFTAHVNERSPVRAAPASCLHVDADGLVTLGPCRRIRRAEVWCGAA